MKSFKSGISETPGFTGIRKKEHKLTMMSLRIVTVFIITYTLENIVLTVASYGVVDKEYWKFLFHYIQPTAALFMTLNPSINIVFYCIFNKKFRMALLKLLHLGKETQPAQSRKTTLNAYN